MSENTQSNQGYTLTADNLSSNAKKLQQAIEKELELKQVEIIRPAENTSEVASISIKKEQLSKYITEIRSSNIPGIQNLMTVLEARINQIPKWEFVPEIIATIPVVGVGNQELQSVSRFFEVMKSQSQMIQSGELQLVLLVNRPEDIKSDDVYEYIKQLSIENDLFVNVFDISIPATTGRNNEEIPEMAEKPNDPLIGVIRNLLDVVAMELTQNSDNFLEANDLPLMLQMDIDFEGFRRGDFSQIVKLFSKNPEMKFLQCTSDWDSEINPTQDNPLLELGAALMRGLIGFIKNRLNNQGITKEEWLQIIFEETIQRGIQVPQARRMEAVASSKSYGFLRLTADELDFSLRQFAQVFGIGSIGSSKEIEFLWSNRRALEALRKNSIPPISQWSQTSFGVDDVVRTKVQKTNLNQGQQITTEAVINIVNQTLARLPMPASWVSFYKPRFERYLGAYSQKAVAKIENDNLVEYASISLDLQMLKLVGSELQTIPVGGNSEYFIFQLNNFNQND